MCSFFGIKSENKEYLSTVLEQEDAVFEFMKHRGPDLHNIIQTDNGFILGGFVLAINDSVAQPVSKDGDYLLWNGEIYNCPKEYTSDTKYLLDLFTSGNALERMYERTEDNDGCVSPLLDGEYAIAYIKDNLVHLITDDFYTKPLCYTITEDTLVFSSYESAIKKINPNFIVKHALPNTHYIFDTEKYELISQNEIYEWDFEPRYNTFERWDKAYKNSILKRVATDKKIFLPLSSGYDSGGICCELIHHNIPCTIFSYRGLEDADIMEKRAEVISNQENMKYYIIHPEINFEENFKDFYSKVENHIAYHHSGRTEMGTPYLDIYHAHSCFAHFLICKVAKQQGHDICLSGHGSDEIYSDYYSPNTRNASTLKGDYRNVRSRWPNFDMGYGRNILGMFDRAAGSCGVETRYPYLDRNAVQNFLWLSDELKNSSYKQCLNQLMRKRDFPLDEVNLKVPLRIFEGDKHNVSYKGAVAAFYIQNNIKRPSYIKWL